MLGQLAASLLSDMAPGTRFRPVLEESSDPAAKRVILCSGKHYYPLSEHLATPEANITQDIAIIRIEELSPFPYRELTRALSKYNDPQIVWAQEEPENQGAWTYVRPRLEGILHGLGKRDRVVYAGRKSSAAVATGVGGWHKAEVAELLRLAVEAR